MNYIYDQLTNSHAQIQTWETYLQKDGQVHFDGELRTLFLPKWYENLHDYDWWRLCSTAGNLAGLGLSATGFTPADTLRSSSTESLFVRC